MIALVLSTLLVFAQAPSGKSTKRVFVYDNGYIIGSTDKSQDWTQLSFDLIKSGRLDDVVRRCLIQYDLDYETDLGIKQKDFLDAVNRYDDDLIVQLNKLNRIESALDYTTANSQKVQESLAFKKQLLWKFSVASQLRIRYQEKNFAQVVTPVKPVYYSPIIADGSGQMISFVYANNPKSYSFSISGRTTKKEIDEIVRRQLVQHNIDYQIIGLDHPRIKQALDRFDRDLLSEWRKLRRKTLLFGENNQRNFLLQQIIATQEELIWKSSVAVELRGQLAKNTTNRKDPNNVCQSESRYSSGLRSPPDENLAQIYWR